MKLIFLAMLIMFGCLFSVESQNVLTADGLAGFVTISSSGGSSSLLNGLQAYYALSDLTDATGNGNTLINNNSATFVSGKVGNCVNVIGASSQYLSISDNSYFQMGTGDFSVAAWVNYTINSTIYYIVSYGTSGAAGYWISDAFGGIQVGVYSGFSGVNVSSAGTFNDGAWHLVVLTAARAGNLTLYVDNTSQGTPTSLSGVGSVNNAAGFQIGDINGGSFFSGTIDEVGIWNRVLTATEITHLYNGGVGTTYPFTGL